MVAGLTTACLVVSDAKIMGCCCAWATTAKTDKNIPTTIFRIVSPPVGRGNDLLKYTFKSVKER
jgi:hypothetical protein